MSVGHPVCSQLLYRKIRFNVITLSSISGSSVFSWRKFYKIIDWSIYHYRCLSWNSFVKEKYIRIFTKSTLHGFYSFILENEIRCNYYFISRIGLPLFRKNADEDVMVSSFISEESEKELELYAEDLPKSSDDKLWYV